MSQEPNGRLRTTPNTAKAAITINPILADSVIIGPSLPRNLRTTHNTQATASTPTSATAMMLLLTAPMKSPRVRSLTARRPPQPGQGRPVSSRNGQNP